jgi:sugar phosphate isomerase/epimerase
MNQQMSRRSVLRAGMGITAAVTLGGAARDVLAADADPYGGLPLGLQSYTLRDRPFKDAMEAEKGLGLHYVEVYSRHLGWTSTPDVVTVNGVNAKPDEALAILKDNGVTAVSIGAIPISADEKKTREIFEFAKRLGLKNLSISPDPKAFDLLDKLCDEYNVTCGIHDHGPEDKRWGKIAQIEAGLKDHNKKIGLCNDTGHFIRNGENPLEACGKFKDRLHAMHLKDFKKDANGKWEDCVLGDGGLDVNGVIKFLLDNKYAGVLAIEYEGKNPVESVQKSLERVKEAVRKARG